MRAIATARPQAASVERPVAARLRRGSRRGAGAAPGGAGHEFGAIAVHARLQPKLAVSAPGDVHERQADAVADRVMRMSEGDPPVLRSKAAASSLGDGGNLDRETRPFMQRRFGADFGGVRVHTDAAAARMSRELRAEAFTVGRDVYFADGRYAPGSDRGRRLLAHELAHTIQQGYSCVRRPAAIRQAVTGLVDVPEETAAVEAEEAVPAVTMIQPSAKWTGAAVHETRNLAEIVLGGDAPITWHLLNGKKLETEADADGAIKAPGVTTSGSGSDWKATVDSVPAQEGSGDETVLGPGPWTKATTKAAAGAATGLAACSGADNTTLTAVGKPSDDAVYKANRKHEDHHLTDHQAAFDDAIGNWDKKVQEAKDKGTEFKGVSAAAATGALWAAMGNTPKNAARSYRTQGFTKGAAFHKTATGGPMAAKNAASNKDCSACSIEVTNPA